MTSVAVLSRRARYLSVADHVDHPAVGLAALARWARPSFSSRSTMPETVLLALPVRSARALMGTGPSSPQHAEHQGLGKGEIHPAEMAAELLGHVLCHPQVGHENIGLLHPSALLSVCCAPAIPWPGWSAAGGSPPAGPGWPRQWGTASPRLPSSRPMPTAWAILSSAHALISPRRRCKGPGCPPPAPTRGRRHSGEEGGQLLPGDKLLRLEVPPGVAVGDAVLLGPGRRLPVPGGGVHVTKGDRGGRERGALHAPEHGDHRGPGHVGVGGKLGVADPLHVALLCHLIDRRLVPGAGGHIGVRRPGGQRQGPRRRPGCRPGPSAVFSLEPLPSRLIGPNFTIWILRNYEHSIKESAQRGRAKRPPPPKSPRFLPADCTCWHVSNKP